MGSSAPPHTYGTGRPPLPLFTYVVCPHLILALVLAIRPRPALHWRLATWVGLTSALLYATKFDVGEDFDNWSTGIVLLSLSFTAFVLLFLGDPAVDCRHETQKEDESVAQMPFWKRFYWLLCIVLAFRGIGWNYQVPNLPARPRHSRLQYIISRLCRVLWYMLVADVMHTYMDTNPLFSLAGDTAKSMRSQGLVLMAFNVAAYMSMSYCTLHITYDATALLAVALRLSEPEYWPVITGRFRDGYTVRRFWSHSWHYTLRRFVSAIGKAAARALGCTPGTWLSSRVQLYVGFALSGLAHVPGDLMLAPQWTGLSFPYFIYQATFIAMEDLILAVGRRYHCVRERQWVRFMGYVWTFGWLLYSTPWFNDWHLRAGMGRHRLFRFSLVRPALEGIKTVVGIDVLQWLAERCAM